MFWIISFFVSWFFTFTLVGGAQILHFLPVGIFSMFLQVTSDYIASKLDIYTLRKNVPDFLGSSPFFSLGLAFTAGIFIAHFFPYERWQNLLYLLFFSALATLVHAFFIKFEYIDYKHYSFWGIFFLNILEISAILGFFLCLFPHS